MEDQAQLESLLTALENSCVEDGFEILKKILHLRGEPAPLELQQIYVDEILGLMKREPSLGRVQDIGRRVKGIPAYRDNPIKILEHAQALVPTIAALTAYTDRVTLAESITQFKGYGARFDLQVAHSQALVEVSHHGDAKCLQIAERIRQIPSFRDSLEIQIACAKACQNASNRASRLNQTQKIIEILRSLPQIEESQEIAQCLEKVEQKHAHLVSKGAKLKKEGPSKPALVGAGLLLVGVTAAFSFQAFQSDAPTTEAASSVEFLTDEEEYLKYSTKGQRAYLKGDYDEATTYGAMALRRAKIMRSPEVLADSLDLLGSSYLRLKNLKRAEDFFKQVPPSQVARLGSTHLDAAEKALRDKERKALVYEMSTLITIYKSNSSDLDPTELQRASDLSEKGKLWSHASVIQVHLGDLAKAAEFSESAGDSQRAKELLEILVKQDPKEKPRLSAFQLRGGEQLLKNAETAFAKKDYAQADAQATSALSMLKGADKAHSLLSQAHTVRAKASYLQEQYAAALGSAKLAYQASPSPEAKARLETYRIKDAEHITRDELVVGTFVFPPAKKTNSTYTYCYFFGHSDNRVTRGKEMIFQEPEHKIEPKGSYYRNRSLVFYVDRYAQQTHSYRFSLPREELKPGSYSSESRTRYGSPNVSLSYNYQTGGGKSRFVIHEIDIDKRGGVKRFAADFIKGDYRGKKAVFGKVRYNSRYE